MGMQSWRTSDTDRSITHVASGITFDVYMITRDGRIFHENDYFGYASFGGQDFFNLIAEMNGYKTRDEAIWAYYGVTVIFKGDVEYIERTDFFSWEDKIHEGKSVNELRAEGWEKIRRQPKGLLIPKFVEKLPSKDNWEAEFDKLPASPDCEYQGYCPDDDDEEIE